jgi:dTDP-4-amino-4,6-dideoxygalactose transaminase
MIRLSKSSIGNNEKQAVLKVLENEMLGMGQEVNQFENALSEYFKRKVVCVSTGTAALQLAIQALGIGIGDEVLVPSLTYLASFQAISATGAKPIPCEVNDDLLIDLEDATKKINKNLLSIFNGSNTSLTS